MRSRRTRIAAVLIALPMIALVAVLVAWALASLEPSVAAMEALIVSWGPWGVAASILLMIVHSFVPFPAEVVALANGMLYGPVWGTAITWSGAMLGAWLAFGLARRLGRPFVRRMVAERHHRAIDGFAARQGGGVLLFSRFVPVISFNLINYAAGLTAISWWTFTWATGLGILPLTCLMVLAGDQMWKGEVEVWLWLMLAGVGGWLVWWRVTRARRTASGTAADREARPAAGRSGGGPGDASASGRPPGRSGSDWA